jgi:hypothetical protein
MTETTTLPHARLGQNASPGGDALRLHRATQQLAAMAKRRNTNLFEVLIGHTTEDCKIDIVLGKALGILG